MNPAYLEDASGFRGYAERLFIPSSEAEVCEALRQASASGTPVTIAGAGTGVTGARVPLGGWVLSLEKFCRLEIRPGSAVAGAGVLLRDFDAQAAASRQFYPPDPTETAAAIGGTIATNASGARSFRYGATRRHVLALRVVLAGGTAHEFRRGEKLDFSPGALPLPHTTKNTAGYYLQPDMDWVDLFIGSEGTLGVITEAELRLLPAPAALMAGVVFFASEAAALDAVDAWRADPTLRMLEYFDRASLDLLGRPSGAALLFEQELASEDDAAIDQWEQRVAGAVDTWFAVSTRDRERLREFRHALPEKVNAVVRRRGFLKMHSDYAVPIDRNREMLSYYRQRLEAEFAGRYVIFGHIGDAHLHVNILPASAEDCDRGSALLEDFARQAVALGGTVSAEHSLGKRKKHLLRLQYSPAEIERMQAVKRRLDPQWLLGRGTLF